MPLTSVIDTQNHPWLSGQTPQNFFRSRRVFHAPAHLSVKKIAEILLFINPEDKTFNLTNSQVTFNMSDSIQSVFDNFMQDKKQSEKFQNILDLNFYTEHLTSNTLIDDDPTDIFSHVQSNYMPKNGFFEVFEA